LSIPYGVLIKTIACFFPESGADIFSPCTAV
jgi:hypothetical protein